MEARGKAPVLGDSLGVSLGRETSAEGALSLDEGMRLQTR